MKIYAVGLILSLVLGVTGCDNKSVNTVSKNNAQPQSSVPYDVFNTSDKSISTNGNLLVAVNKFNNMPSNGLNSVIATTVESISKSSYSAIGKLYKITGKTYKVEELPPSSGVNNKWSEVLMLARNPNSSVGASTIDCIYLGGVEHIKPNKPVTCTGYFIGTFDSQNALGGSVESYVFVGYAINAS